MSYDESQSKTAYEAGDKAYEEFRKHRLAMAMRRVQLRLDIHRILKAARHRRQAEVAALTFNSRYGTFAAAP